MRIDPAGRQSYTLVNAQHRLPHPALGGGAVRPQSLRQGLSL